MKPWKVQKFFGDVVYDLRSRGLLPIAILLLIAMIAVPVLISRGSSGDSSSSLQPVAGPVKAPPETETAVVTYASPGVREYKKRLGHRSSKDPFKQPAAAQASSEEASQLNSTVPSAGGAGSTTSAPSGGSSSGGSSSGATTTHHFVLIHSVGDVSFGDAAQPLQRHKSLKNYASLPNPVAPVMIYLGSTLDEKKAVFSLSKSTNPLSGNGACAPSPLDCSLLALAPGESEDVTYGVDGRIYRVKVNGIRTVRSNPSSKPHFTK